MQHKKTGLLAAMSEEMPGFIVHAHTEEELEGKLAGAFAAFKEAIGEPVEDVKITEETPAGFWPPTYLASGELKKEAA